MKAAITFHGGVGSVTGANFLLEIDDLKILVDCGFFQGSKVADDQNRQKFAYDPASIDYLLVTHAHLDHIGRIPKLVKDGFRGKIYSTPPTREISELSLIDSMGVLEKESRGSNLPPIYTENDVEQAMRLWETKNYHESFVLQKAGSDKNSEIKIPVQMRDAGHILGSSMFEFVVNNKKIVFTGDLGNSPSLLLPDTEFLQDADYLVMESVYGDRNHESRDLSREKLEDIIENTMKIGGTLMIPVFSIERTQEMIYEIEKMMDEGRIPPVPVFLDSPLAIKVTGIYEKYVKYFNQIALEQSNLSHGLFKFPQLRQTLATDESRAIAGEGKKIILAGSGMSNGGRILHHEKRYLSDPHSALILAGYQAAGSLGRQLEDGLKRVKILGQEIDIRARIISVSGYSGHKGSNDLLEFVTKTSDSLKKVFVVMGEPKSSLYLVQKIRDYLGLDAIAPTAGERVELAL
ncbi:MAG: MBL fold metallo-hydrolase [Patescibacteria group bacterium]